MSQLPQKQNTCEVWKFQRLCLWHILKSSLFEMSPRNWVKTTLCDFYKKELIYYVDIMSIRQVTECWNFVHKPLQIFFFQIKACLVSKLCLISFPSQLNTMELLSIQKFCSLVCEILLVLLSSYFEVINFFFQSVENKFLRLTWLTSINRYDISC